MNREQIAEVSAIETEVMQHALGLNYSGKETRNYYYTDSDDRVWNELVAKGYAKKRRGWDEDSAYFFVTQEGKDALLAVME